MRRLVVLSALSISIVLGSVPGLSGEPGKQTRPDSSWLEQYRVVNGHDPKQQGIGFVHGAHSGSMNDPVFCGRQDVQCSHYCFTGDPGNYITCFASCMKQAVDFCESRKEGAQDEFSGATLNGYFSVPTFKEFDRRTRDLVDFVVSSEDRLFQNMNKGLAEIKDRPTPEKLEMDKLRAETQSLRQRLEDVASARDRRILQLETRLKEIEAKLGLGLSEK